MRAFVLAIPLRPDGGPDLGMPIRKLLRVAGEEFPDPDGAGDWFFRKVRPGVFNLRNYKTGQDMMRLHRLGTWNDNIVFVGWGTRPRAILKHLDTAKFRLLKDAWSRPAWRDKLIAMGIKTETCADCGNPYPVTPSHPAGHSPAVLVEHTHDA